MKQYTASEAREKFAEILAHVESGERIEVTKHGEPIAEIVRKTSGKIAKPGWMSAEGWEVKIADDFDAVPQEFEEYV